MLPVYSASYTARWQSSHSHHNENLQSRGGGRRSSESNSLSLCSIKLIYVSRYSDSLRAGRSGDRIPVGARFSAPVQTGPGAHPASCTMGTGSFPGVKRPGRGADPPPPYKCRGHKGVGLSPSGPSWPVIGPCINCSSYFPENTLGLSQKERFVNAA